jgi:outer membrane protein
MNRWRPWLAAVLLAASAGVAVAQDAGKIGYVSIDRILRDSVPAKAAQQKLETEFKQRDKEMQDLAARLKGLGERLERDAAVMNETERQRRQREFAELEREFQRKKREVGEDFQQRRNEELQQVVEKANRAIRQIAEQEKFDVVLQEAVYASPRVDITERVLRALANPR